MRDADSGAQTGSRFCSQCGGSIRAQTRFCQSCGASTTARNTYDQEANADARAGWALISSYIGPLLALIVASFAHELGHSELATSLILTAGILAAGVISLGVLGKASWRESLSSKNPSLDHPASMLLGVPVGLLTLACAHFYVVWFHDPAAVDEIVTTSGPPLLFLVFTVAVLPSLCEEFLCRGAQWAVLRRVVSERETMIVTSMLFALIHGLNGGFTLEFPHRFVAGLAFGWLRLKTGNLGAPIVAHFTNNFAAVLLFE